MKYERNMSDYERRIRSEKAKKQREYRKRNHFCIKCGCDDELTESGRSYCKACLEKRKVRIRKYHKTDKGKAAMRRYRNKRRRMKAVENAT
jgi:hypothetical protein